MKRLIAFVMTLLMPIILIVGGGAVTGWGLTNDWEVVVWIGLGMIGAGLAWGFFLFLWASNGSL